jgi:outer membrane protein
MLFLLSFTVQGEEMKIGYVDFNKALNESDKGRKATEMLEGMIKSKRTILSDKEEEIRKLEEEIKKQLSVLSSEAKREKEDELKKLLRDAQRMKSDFEDEIKKEEAILTREIQKELMEVIDKISRDEGYTIVFERGVSGILYIRKDFDITDKVIKIYNEGSKVKK